MVKRLSLLYFNDGESIYIYRDNEIQQQLFQSENISLSKLKEYLQDVGLYDLHTHYVQVTISVLLSLRSSLFI